MEATPIAEGGDSRGRGPNMQPWLHTGPNRIDGTPLDMDPPSGAPGLAGRYPNSQNGKARVKSGTSQYSWRHIWLRASIVFYSLAMLVNITNAVVIPTESPNSIGTGDSNPETDTGGPSNAVNTPQPMGGNPNGGWSTMDVMAGISVTVLGSLVYLSTKKSRDRHINLGISLLAAFWIQWTIFRGDASIFLFSM